MKLFASSLATALILTTGCSVSTTPTITATEITLSGKVHGGQQPVSGAAVQLYAVSFSGYGTAATPLLPAPVMTDGAGGFNLTGSGYACPTVSTTPVYLVATGGNPGLTASGNGTVNNAALSLMAALGPCNTLTSSSILSVNELTTVAATWSLAQFMSGYTNVGTSATNKAGLVNAFSTAANLVNSSNGQTFATTLPAGATEPIAELDTLANILASCVNTSGGTAGDSTPCGRLFTAATPPSGTAPTDTITAAVNIALYPGQNASTLYNLTTSTGPFQPTLTSAPTDWTVSLNYAQTVATSLAVDASGNVWVSSSSGLVELSPAGGLLSPAAGYSYNGASAGKVAIDPAGNIWVGGKTLSQFSPSGAGLSPTGGYTAYQSFIGLFYTTAALSIDGNNNLWAMPSNGNSLGEFSNTGTATGTYTLPNVGHPSSLAIDETNSLWAGNGDGSFVSRILRSGTSYTVTNYSSASSNGVATDASNNALIVGSNKLGKVTPAGAYTSVATSSTGGIYAPQSSAVDGSGNIWLTNSTSVTNQPGSLSQFSANGTAITPVYGYLSTTFATPYSTALDGSGNAWSLNSTNGSLTEMVGVAVPTVTPLSLAVKNATIGTRP